MAYMQSLGAVKIEVRIAQSSPKWVHLLKIYIHPTKIQDSTRTDIIHAKHIMKCVHKNEQDFLLPLQSVIEKKFCSCATSPGTQGAVLRD